MIKTQTFDCAVLAKDLAHFLAPDIMSFVDMVWEGNEYTGEGQEYPVVNEDTLARYIEEYLNR